MTQSSERALFLRPGALGDALLLAPALAAYRARWPSHEIIVAAHPTAGPLLTIAGLADRFISRDDPEIDRLFGPVDSSPRFLGSRLTSAVAYARDADGLLRRRLRALTDREPVVVASQPPAEEGTHVAQHLLAALEPFDVHGDALAWGRAGALSRSFTAPGDGSRPLVIHPGSGSPRKNWPIDRFLALARRAHLEAGLDVLLVLGPAEEKLRSRLLEQDVAGMTVRCEPSPMELARLLASAAAYVGNDSGVSHLAGLVGAPTLTLFGPTDPRRWQPVGPRVRVLQRASLSEITVEDALDGLVALHRAARQQDGWSSAFTDFAAAGSG